MNETRNNFYVGLFVLFGLIAFGALVVMFSRSAVWSMSGPAYTLQVRFDTAAGIRDGRQVNVGGIEVGRVRRVGFASETDYTQGVLVELIFDRDPGLRVGTTAQTAEPGIGQGRPPIDLLPGPLDAPRLVSGAVIPGRIRSAMDSLIPPDVIEPFVQTAEQISTAAQKVEPLIEALLAMFEPRTPAEVDVEGGPEGNLASAAARLDKTFRGVNEILEDRESRERLGATLENLYAVSAEAREAMVDIRRITADLADLGPRTGQVLDTARDKIIELDERLDRIADQVGGNLDQIADVLRSTQTVATRLERGEGTLGMLTTDPRLYEATVLTVQRLAAAVQEFQLLLEEWRKGRIKVAL